MRAVVQYAEGKIGVALLMMLVLVIVLGPLIAPASPTALSAETLAPPSGEHLLGTDALGRDVLSRFLYGGRSVIVLPLVATVGAFVLGSLVGLIAAVRGGWLDAVVGRILDLALSLPTILVVLLVVAVLGHGSIVLAVAIAAVLTPRVARVMRGSALLVVHLEYVAAARVRGESDLAILVREVAPNVSPTAMVEFATRFTQAVIAFATLNFLGLGLQPPSSNWGVMVSESRATLQAAPWAALAPALAIGMLAVAVNMLADALTQHYDLGLLPS